MRGFWLHLNFGCNFVVLALLISAEISASEAQFIVFGTRGSADIRNVSHEPKTFNGFVEQQINLQPASVENQANPPVISLQAWSGQRETNFHHAAINTRSPQVIKASYGGVRQGVLVVKPRQKASIQETVSAFVQPSEDSANKSPYAPIIDRQVEKVDLNPANKRRKFVSGTYRNVDRLQRTPALEVAALPPENTPDTQGQLDVKPTGINASILFSADSANLKPATIRDLEKIASLLKSKPNKRLELRSFASGDKPRRLALTRALRVRRHLLANGINSNRLIVKAKGLTDQPGNTDRLDLVEID